MYFPEGVVDEQLSLIRPLKLIVALFRPNEYHNLNFFRG